MDTTCFRGTELSPDPRGAIKSIAEVLLKKTYPLMLTIRNKLQNYNGPLPVEDFNKIHNVFVLCSSQIQKCFQTLFNIFKTEHHKNVVLEDSRQCLLDRLSWCVDRLIIIEHLLDSPNENIPDEEECSLLITPIYFVNWVDHTFDELGKLSEIICRAGSKEDEDDHSTWKNEVIECVSDLHIVIEELLLSAMTLSKYCLPVDQNIVKARCQVVLRESKALLSELITGDTGSAFKPSLETLKLPLMPYNVNVQIDVLKDGLYVLETNANTALLALLVHCFSHSTSPVDKLREHFKDMTGTCSCHVKSDGEVTEDCSFVKEFDFYNERLLQIGTFAVSCSSDQKRIISLRSGLASLEALDPHLVPALTLSPDSQHAALLVDSWRREVQDIRDGVFLIVEPAAFAEKSKQMMHTILLEVLNAPRYNNEGVRSVIDIGGVVCDFFSLYNQHEPDALSHYEKLTPLLADLDKVQMECKIVSNLLSSGEDYVYDIKKFKNNKETSLDQLKKRLKLLYTLIGRVNSLVHPKDNDQFFDEIEDEAPKDVTRTIYQNNAYTYVNSRKPGSNMSRSIFARTTNPRSSTRNFPLAKLTKHLRAKKCDELNFSEQLDGLFNLSEVKKPEYTDYSSAKLINKHLEKVREPSILYQFSPKKRASLRKMVMSKHCNAFQKNVQNNFKESIVSESGSLIDETTSLQITEILNQMTEMSQALSTTQAQSNATTTDRLKSKVATHTLKIPINKPYPISKPVWNIPVNSAVEVPLDDSASNETEPSSVSSFERVNDIRLVESKLNCLKFMEETSL